MAIFHGRVEVIDMAVNKFPIDFSHPVPGDNYIALLEDLRKALIAIAAFMDPSYVDPNNVQIGVKRYSTDVGQFEFWDGEAWQFLPQPYARKNQNLSDLTNHELARANLGLGNLAVKSLVGSNDLDEILDFGTREVLCPWMSNEQLATFVGSARRIIWNTGSNHLTIHDGLTPGGIVLANKSDLDNYVTSAALALELNDLIDAIDSLEAAALLTTPQTLTAAQKAQVKKNLDISDGLPAGAMIPYAGGSVPASFLMSNGAAKSRTNYANLYAAIGTKWGAGDGSSTFALPNTHRRFIEGTTTASEVGTYVGAGAPNMTGAIPGTANWGASSGVFYVIEEAASGISTGGYARGVFGLEASRASVLFGASTTIQPLSARMSFVIKF